MAIQARNGQPANYNATEPTLTDGDVSGLNVDVNGNVKQTAATLHAGEDLTNDVQKTREIWTYLNITTNATTTAKSLAGTFGGFTINNNGFTTAGTITIYDNTAGSGTLIGTWTVPLMPPGSTTLATTFFPPQKLNVSFSVGLTIVTAATAPACNITVQYI